MYIKQHLDCFSQYIQNNCREWFWIKSFVLNGGEGKSPNRIGKFKQIKSNPCNSLFPQIQNTPQEAIGLQLLWCAYKFDLIHIFSTNSSHLMKVLFKHYTYFSSKKTLGVLYL